MSELPTNKKQELWEVLNSFGLKETEQAVYLAILQSGPTTTTPLAEALSMPPTTVESILRRLYNDGLVATTKKKSRHIYEALEPIALRQILEEKLRDVNKIIPILQEISQEKMQKSKIHVFYRERMTEIFIKALSAKNKLIYEIVSAKELQEIIGEKLHFTRRRLEKNIRLKSLRVESNEIKKYSRLTHVRELREAKFLPRDFKFKANILFWDNTVAIFSTKGEGVAVVIESASIKEMFLQLFEMLWTVSRTMETA